MEYKGEMMMFISNIRIENFRNFDSISVDFRDGINLLIGQNNAGKSNLLRALAIIFDSYSKKQLSINDIYNNISLEELKLHSPKVTITVLLSQSENENLMGDELVTVSNWLISLQEPYLAQVQYEFFLPEAHEAKYKDHMQSVSTKEEAWKIINDNFIRLYINKTWVGNPENQVQIDGESLNKFDFQFLDAIRDVERDMFSGRNTLLKNVIDFFIDYDIKSDKNLTDEQQFEQIASRKKGFEDISESLVEKLQERLKCGNKEILSYADGIGASFDKSQPDFEGKITESELYSVLQLIVKQNTGMSIPISNNGLGYNNLIFMSLLLAKMQVDSDGRYLGSNAKVFPILAIEEPEAHLHPTMQFQFIKFLKKNISENKVKQVFITSHSTHITSSTQLDDIICLYKENGRCEVAYPGRVFFDIESDESKKDKPDSKKYVQRFLDATKSNMLFAEKVIFVEGIAEQLLMPIFADYIGKSLEDNHISVINIGGSYFEHFLYLFDSNKENTIKRKIACITDLDPTRKEKDKEKAKFKKCYPFEMSADSSSYDYELNLNMEKYEEGKHPNIRSFMQDKTYGKTLEYQLAFENEKCRLLLTPSLQNKDELNDLMTMIEENKPLDDMLAKLRGSDENNRILDSITKSNGDSWSDEMKKKAIIASRYLNSVGKGENALELSSELRENLSKKDTEGFVDFNVPIYIKEAIEWMCEDI
ncbi:AAA family ATPase [Tissierella sp.]|uniref:ATP-dependent nuclease n=1 Tax=Tissierella sp. TaxID=41274 RepID=UPI0028AE8DE2|nr:AAA family ATPase [Tissierella sp.]